MHAFPVVHRVIRDAFLVTLLMLFPAVSITNLCAQSTISGYVTGTVADPSGAVVKAATVRLENTATKLSLSASTSSEGVYRASILFHPEPTCSAQHWKASARGRRPSP
jgi:hypothetical protein